MGGFFYLMYLSIKLAVMSVFTWIIAICAFLFIFKTPLLFLLAAISDINKYLIKTIGSGYFYTIMMYITGIIILCAVLYALSK